MKAKRAKKEPAGKKIKIQVVLDREVVAVIDDLAERANMTRSYFTATLLEEAVEDNAWMYKLITSKLMAPMRALAKKLDKGRSSARKKRYEQGL